MNSSQETSKAVFSRANNCFSQNQMDFLHRIVTGDENWIHYDNPKRTKSWAKPGHASTSTAKSNIHGKKLMLCIWWDHLRVIYYELLKPNENITAERYQQQLMQLSQALKFKHHNMPKEMTKWSFSTARLANTLLKSSRELWKHLTGMFYRARCIRQALLLRTTTCSRRWLMAWLSSTSLLMKKPKIGSILGPPQKMRIFPNAVSVCCLKDGQR